VGFSPFPNARGFVSQYFPNCGCGDNFCRVSWHPEKRVEPRGGGGLLSIPRGTPYRVCQKSIPRIIYASRALRPANTLPIDFNCNKLIKRAPSCHFSQCSPFYVSLSVPRDMAIVKLYVCMCRPIVCEGCVFMHKKFMPTDIQLKIKGFTRDTNYFVFFGLHGFAPLQGQKQHNFPNNRSEPFQMGH
jgi:hypothetical protein